MMASFYWSFELFLSSIQISPSQMYNIENKCKLLIFVWEEFEEVQSF